MSSHAAAVVPPEPAPEQIDIEDTIAAASAEAVPAERARHPGAGDMSGGATHPVAELFPPLPPAELDALAADIQANGLREPICRHRDGRIIDGRNRWAACEKAGVPCAAKVYQGKDEELLTFVLSMNLHRRHLDESQRAMVAAKVANLGEGRPKETSRIQPVSQASAAALLSVGVSSSRSGPKARLSSSRRSRRAGSPSAPPPV
jgi:hypothetical protein